MGWATGTAVYLVIWWLVIFMVLPWGAESVIDEDDVKKGHASSAPKNPRMLLKIAITTVISAVERPTSGARRCSLYALELPQ